MDYFTFDLSLLSGVPSCPFDSCVASSVLTAPGYKLNIVTLCFFNSIPQSPAILSKAAYIDI